MNNSEKQTFSLLSADPEKDAILFLFLSKYWNWFSPKLIFP